MIERQKTTDKIGDPKSKEILEDFNMKALAINQLKNEDDKIEA